MAYNPNLYNPYGQTQPYSWSQPVWQTAPQQVSNQPVNGLVSVTGIEGAKAYQLPPNSSMPLFDRDSDVFYLKTTDSAGYPTIKKFAFSPVEADETPSEAGFVTKAEFDALAEKVASISGERGKHAE